MMIIIISSISVISHPHDNTIKQFDIKNESKQPFKFIVKNSTNVYWYLTVI